MTCPREHETVLALKSDVLAPELERHISECASCSEAARIARSLTAIADDVNIERADARILLLLAAERRHAHAEEKLTRITRFVPSLVIAIVVVVTLFRRILTGDSPLAGLLGADPRSAPVFLIAAAFVVVVVWTAPIRGRTN
jgi:hypothetical protein